MAPDELEDRLSRIMRRLGFGDCPSAVYSRLFFREEPSSLGEISESTGYSPTAVSLALAELESSSLVTKRKQGRKYLYSAEESFIQKFERTVEELLEREIRPFRKALEVRVGSVRHTAREKLERVLESVRDAELRLRAYISTLRSSETTE